MTQLIKSLRNRTKECALTALAVAAFLLASQPAAAATFLFTLAPVNIQTAPGATGFFEVDLTNTGSTETMIGGFRFGLTTNDPSDITFDSVTTGTLQDLYIFTGVGSWWGKNGASIAGTPGPTVAAMDQGNGYAMTLAANATVGLGYVTYQIGSAATPGSVISIGFAPPSGYYGYCSSSFCEFLTASDANGATGFGTNYMGYAIDSSELGGGTITVGSGGSLGDAPEPEPAILLPVGLLLIGLGALRERRLRVAKRRRKMPGVRKSALPEAGEPGKAGPGEHDYAT